MQSLCCGRSKRTRAWRVPTSSTRCGRCPVARRGYLAPGVCARRSGPPRTRNSTRVCSWHVWVGWCCACGGLRARARSCVRACSKRGAACGSANASAWAMTWYSQVGSAAVPRRAPVVGAAASVRAGEAHQRADVPCESAGVARANAAAVRFGRQQFWRRRKKPWLGHWQRQTVNANSLSPIEQCLSANWFTLVVDSSNTRQTRTRFERI